VPPAPKAKPAESRPPDVATPPAVVAPSSNAPASIPYDDVSPEERYAAALADIGAGRVRAASDALAALSPEVAATGLGPRVAREQERVAAWTAARDAFFAKAAAEDLTLELSVARVSTTKWRLRGVEDGQAVLDDRKGGVKRVPVEDLDPLALARQMDGVEPSWTRFYVYVLREDERWKKLLKEDGGPASALLEDARTDYPRLVRLGRAVAGLRALASEPAATAEGELERQLGILRILLAELGDTELVERKRELLRDHALALLERRFTLQNPLKRLAGKAELAGKRLRVAYDFSDARQLADFDPAPYPLLASKGFSGPEGEEGSFTVSEGRLVATGRASLRTVYDLGAPMAVHYDVEFVDQQAPDPHFHLALGVCDDGQEHFLWAINLNVLQLLDRSATDYTEDPPRALYLDTRYAMELEHDGQRVTLRCEGLEQATLGAGNRSSGAVFLRAVGTIPVRVDALVIEGQLLPESFVRMQRSWAEAQMAAW
jgi:hypothetical protein